jgi:glycosyltransferase involved in cell wall biosynthesis
MKKIALLTFYRGHHERGVERWATDFATQISESYRTTIFQAGKVYESDLQAMYRVRSLYTPIRKINVSKLFKLFFLDYYSLKVAIFTLKALPDLWHDKNDIVIPTDGGWQPAILRIFTWITRSRMVIVGHAGIGRDDANNLWSFPDIFVALSSYVKSWAHKVNPFVRIFYIPNGVDLVQFKAKEKKDRHSLKTIICVNALTKSKRVDCIINAVSLINNAKLLIVGTGEEESNLRNIAKIKLAERVEFLHVPFGEMPKLYRNADLLVSASESYYSFEMVLIEAMACGTPVVANDDPIRREIIAEGGMVGNPDDTKEFAAIIKSALNFNWNDSPVRVANRYSWSHIAKEYRELFTSMIGK